MDNIQLVTDLIKKSKFMMILTGAGTSAESGLPTFRGKDGYWVKGKNYHPMELATFRSFIDKPDIVWEWYHYRREVYSNATPNDGHLAIVELESYCNLKSKEFLLVTQNVDNLHQKAGSESMHEIHGNIFNMRCSEECSNQIYPIPLNSKGIPVCPDCNKFTRPHVLWFDESYNETYFKYNSVINNSKQIDLLFIIGTTLQTSLPASIFRIAYDRGIKIVEVNIEPLNLQDYGVISVKGSSGDVMSRIIKNLYSDPN